MDGFGNKIFEGVNHGNGDHNRSSFQSGMNSNINSPR